MSVNTARKKLGRPRWALLAAIVAVLFGILTVLSGGRALFGGDAAESQLRVATATFGRQQTLSASGFTTRATFECSLVD